VLSEAAWQRRLGGRADTIGRSIRVDGVPHEVIGILPSRSMLPLPDADVWLPAITQGLAPAELWGTSYYALIGRVKAGRPVAEATADLRRLAPIVRDSYPWRMPDVFGANIAAIPLLESAVGDVRTRLGILAVAVALLLASACANVATLVLSRALVREKELAVRAAIGASRRRLLQQLLTETLLLWLCGGVLGLLVAWFGLDLLRNWLPPDVPRVQNLAVDWRAVAVALGATLVTGLGFGVLPAWRMSRPQLVAFLKPNDGGVATTAGRQRVVKGLVVAQLASAVVLVTGSVVLSRSVWNLTQVPPGFDPTGVLSAVLTPDRAACETPEACRTFYQDVLDRLTALPHVTAAGYANLAPLAGETNIFAIDVQDHAVAPGAPAHTAMRQVASPGYFDALDLGVVRGRPLQPADADSGDPVVVINEAFARRFWPGQDPVGKRLRYVWQPTWRTIVGVVADVKQAGLALPAPPAFYLPYGQDSPRDLTLFVESSAAWPLVASDVRRVVAAISPDVPVSAVQPVQSLVDRSLAGSTALLALITLFGAVVVLLGGIGTYGVLASTVAARRRELGIRLALGAAPSTVRRLVVGDALRLCGLAVLVGMPLAVIATRSATSLLYGTGATDLAVPLIVLAVMSAIALAAAALPAVRAARVDVLKAVKDA
ncbi:MAG TPA: FtsX-like permease family protein, partial [Luteitalea sp.]|nr:FtsX-like permease family protein [Luteitalea sp.]